jgi:hypothetical protein
MADNSTDKITIIEDTSRKAAIHILTDEQRKEIGIPDDQDKMYDETDEDEWNAILTKLINKYMKDDIQRGDVILVYNEWSRDTFFFYDGTKVINAYEEKHVPPSFAYPEFGLNYWNGNEYPGRYVHANKDTKQEMVKNLTKKGKKWYTKLGGIDVVICSGKADGKICKEEKYSKHEIETMILTSPPDSYWYAYFDDHIENGFSINIGRVEPIEH